MARLYQMSGVAATPNLGRSARLSNCGRSDQLTHVGLRLPLNPQFAVQLPANSI
jgi:hypothetical protein